MAILKKIISDKSKFKLVKVKFLKIEIIYESKSFSIFSIK